MRLDGVQQIHAPNDFKIFNMIFDAHSPVIFAPIKSHEQELSIGAKFFSVWLIYPTFATPQFGFKNIILQKIVGQF